MVGKARAKRMARNGSTASREELVDLAVRRRALDISIKKAQEEKGLLDEKIMALMEDLGVKSVTSDEVKVTKVDSSTMTIMEDRLKKKVGAQVWNKITRKVLDKDKLEDAVVRGIVNSADVAECTEEVPRKSYLRIT